MMTSDKFRLNAAGGRDRWARDPDLDCFARFPIGSRHRLAPALAGVLGVLAVMSWQGFSPPLARAQQPEPGRPDPAASKLDVSRHYRFIERYSSTEDPTRTDLLVQYQVGFKEKILVTQEKAQGAPGQDQVVSQCIYTERVTKPDKGPTSVVNEVVRRYDKVSSRTSLQIPNFQTKPLEGLKLIYRHPPRGLPLVMCLNSGRQLREQEYLGVVQEPFLPALATILPHKPTRVGDSWPVPREAAATMLGEMPANEGYDLTAELEEVRASSTAPFLTAVMAVKGQATVTQGPAGINARLYFTFAPPPEPAATRPPAEPGIADARAKEKAAGPRGASDSAVEAKGFLSKLSLAEEIVPPLPDDSDNRLRRTIRRELLLERHTGDQLGELLEAPEAGPASVENSWVVFDDTRGRFHFLHPQELRLSLSRWRHRPAGPAARRPGHRQACPQSQIAGSPERSSRGRSDRVETTA